MIACPWRLLRTGEQGEDKSDLNSSGVAWPRSAVVWGCIVPVGEGWVSLIVWLWVSSSPEIRMQEMVSMGVGNKPFLDIKPSEAAINDRAIDYIMKGRGEC